MARLDRGDELAHPGEWPRSAVQPLVAFARVAIDRLRPGIVDRLPGQRGDLAGEPLAVEADERRQLCPGGRRARLRERVEPGRDPRLDGVDERAVEIEHERLGERQRRRLSGIGLR